MQLALITCYSKGVPFYNASTLTAYINGLLLALESRRPFGSIIAPRRRATSKTMRMTSRSLKRTITLLLIFAWTAVLLIIEQSYDLISIGINLIFTASQVFWFRRVGELGQKLIGGKTWRRALAAAGLPTRL